MAITLTAQPVARPTERAGTGAEPNTPDDALVPETRAFGRYTLRYRVGTGGMARVYLAQARAEAGFRKWVAIKLVLPHLAEDPRSLQMFFDEARLAARIDHPNVCTVFDFGEIDGAHFLAMEYLHGEPLTAVLRRAWNMGGEPRGAPRGQGLPPALAARIVADAARGLHAAHELRDARGELAGVVHRDVSPHNVFVLYDGVSKVVDFGIASWSDRLVETTSQGELRGKLPYMAPEQVQHRPVDRRTDIFALGVVLWEALLGRRLFKRDNPGAMCMAVLSDPIPRPRALSSAVPAALDAVAMKALSRDPAARFATADAMARALEDYLASAGQPAGAAHLSDFMHVLFADRIAARAALLRRELGVDADDTVITAAPDDPDDTEPDERKARATATVTVTPERRAAPGSAERTATVSVVGRADAAMRSNDAPTAGASDAAANAPTAGAPRAAEVTATVTTASVPRGFRSLAGASPRASSAWRPWVALAVLAAAGVTLGVGIARRTHAPASPREMSPPLPAAPAPGVVAPSPTRAAVPPLAQQPPAITAATTTVVTVQTPGPDQGGGHVGGGAGAPGSHPRGGARGGTLARSSAANSVRSDPGTRRGGHIMRSYDHVE